MKKLLSLAFGLALFASPALAADISLDGFLRGNCGTVTESGGAGTLNNKCGVITTASLVNPAGSEYAVTLTNSAATIGDIVLWSAGHGTNTTGVMAMRRATVAAGSIVFTIAQSTGVNFNGTMLITYFVLKP